MEYIILDMEWNQPFSMKQAVMRPVRLAGEIIQIGAVKLDENFNCAGNFKVDVRPKFYRKINSYVKKLTKINNAAMNSGIPFLEAFEDFREWCGEKFVFLTWGNDDIPMLRDNMAVHRIDTDWIPPVYNLQIIYCSQILNEFKQVSLSDAVLSVNEEMLQAHDALNDSMSTYEICKHLDLKTGILNYENDLIKMTGKKYEAEILEGVYKNKKEAFSSENVTSFYCPECGEKISCGEVVKQNSGKSIAIAKCRNGEDFFVRFKFIMKKGGRISISRSLRTLDEKSEAFYFEKKAIQEQLCENV